MLQLKTPQVLNLFGSTKKFDRKNKKWSSFGRSSFSTMQYIR